MGRAAVWLWAAVTALVFVVAPPGLSADTNVADYVRENAYVLATLGFIGLAGALLWVRSRVPTSPKPVSSPREPERFQTMPRPKAGSGRR